MEKEKKTPANSTNEQRVQEQKLFVATSEEVATVVDAVTGATWNTHNRIMANLFQQDLNKRAGPVPAYRPAGVESTAHCDASDSQCV